MCHDRSTRDEKGMGNINAAIQDVVPIAITDRSAGLWLHRGVYLVFTCIYMYICSIHNLGKHLLFSNCSTHYLLRLLRLCIRPANWCLSLLTSDSCMFFVFWFLIPSRGVAESWIFDIHLFVRSKSVWRYFVCVLLGVCVLKSSGFLKIIISDSSCHIPRYRSYRAFSSWMYKTAQASLGLVLSGLV
jgi:hypothetical protein